MTSWPPPVSVVVLLLNTEDTPTSPPDHPVEVALSSLRAAGVTDALLRRWLAVGHISLSPRQINGVRSRTSSLKFAAQTRFRVTASGRQALLETAAVELARKGPWNPAVNGTTAATYTPHWDAEMRELWWGRILVKKFTMPAPDQETILNSFQERSWSSSIDDPLRPEIDQNPKEHLRETIKNLNRLHRRRLIRFGGRGDGKGVRWYIIKR